MSNKFGSVISSSFVLARTVAATIAATAHAAAITIPRVFFRDPFFIVTAAVKLLNHCACSLPQVFRAMDAQEERKEKYDKQVQDRAAPADEVNSSKSKNSRKSTLAAIFVGLFDDNSHQHALFVNSCPNSERLLTVTRERYYQAFAIEIPPGYSTGEIKFIAGIPYMFQSNLDKFESEPTISLISSPINEITPLSPKNYHKISSAPVIRGPSRRLGAGTVFSSSLSYLTSTFFHHRRFWYFAIKFLVALATCWEMTSSWNQELASLLKVVGRLCV